MSIDAITKHMAQAKPTKPAPLAQRVGRATTRQNMEELTKSKADKYVEKAMGYKAFKHNYKNEVKQLRYEASKEWRQNNKGWFRTLDIIGVILILLNFGALFMTGVLVVRNDPGKGFAEANPAQCSWNGWSCHTNYQDIIIPMLKQIFIWAILVGLYVYTRNNTFNITGMWIMTAMIIFYISAMTFDFNNDLGLYIGKIIFGR